jgi:hypothetical protein
MITNVTVKEAGELIIKDHPCFCERGGLLLL